MTTVGLMNLRLEVCMGRSFRISHGPAQGAFGPSPKFIFKYVTRTQSKPDFLFFSSLNEARSVYKLP
jgi:hypothetical protein